MRHPKRPGRTEALKRVAKLGRTGRVVQTTHWRERAIERDFDDQDFRAVVRNGSIDEEGEWSYEHRNWKFRIVGRDVEGKAFKVAFGLEPERVVLISGMRKEIGKWQKE